MDLVSADSKVLVVPWKFWTKGPVFFLAERKGWGNAKNEGCLYVYIYIYMLAPPQDLPF